MCVCFSGEQSFCSVRRWCSTVRVFRERGTFLIDISPSACGIYGQLVRSDACDRAIFGVDFADIIVQLASKVGANERETGDS